jgi:hypothetical protein
MYRFVCAFLVLLLTLPALGAQDKPPDKPTTPQEQFQALVKEYADAMKAYREAYDAAESEVAKQKVFQEKYPQPIQKAPRFLELAERHPKDPAALDALTWVMEKTVRTYGSKPSPRTQAAELLLRDNAQSDKIGRVCQNLAYGDQKQSTVLLRGILAKNPHKEMRAEAAMALAQRLSGRARAARQLQDSPALARIFESMYSKDYVEELVKVGADKVEAERDRAFQDFADKYAADTKPARLATLARALVYTDNPGSENLLRSLLDKDPRRDVQGPACLALARMLRQRAVTSTDAEAAKKARRESEQLLERAADKYDDVKLPTGGTVGAKARSALFEMRDLIVGKPAPAVEGVDQDGKKFKLADYRGKVVLLDFWSQY